MKLYNTTGENSEGFVGNHWAGTQADAGKQRAELKKTGYKGVSTDEVDVPTSKADLLAWLTAHKVML